MPLFGVLFIVSRSQKRDALWVLHARGTGGTEPAVKAGTPHFPASAQRSHIKVDDTKTQLQLVAEPLISVQAAGQGWAQAEFGAGVAAGCVSPHSLTAQTTAHPKVTKPNLFFYPHPTEHSQAVLPTGAGVWQKCQSIWWRIHLAQTHKLPAWDRVRHRKLSCVVELCQNEIWGGSVTSRPLLDVQRSFFPFKLLLYGSD